MKAEGSGRFAVALTAQENERFLTGIKNTDEYYNMLSLVNAETSECSRAADRDSIHEGIRRCGVAGLEPRTSPQAKGMLPLKPEENRWRRAGFSIGTPTVRPLAYRGPNCTGLLLQLVSYISRYTTPIDLQRVAGSVWVYSRKRDTTSNHSGLRAKTQRGPIHEANQTWYYVEPLLF